MPWHGNITNPAPNPIQESIDRSEKLSSVNRAEQVRRDKDDRENFTITLDDVDNTILGQLENLQLQVVDVGKIIKVPIFYGPPERWVSAQRDGYMRDKQGKILLPAIVFKRNTTATDETLKFFNRHLIVPVMQKYCEKNAYTQFNALSGQNAPVAEVYNTIVPSHVLITYHFIMWTSYVIQMNKLTETLKFATSNIEYWGTTNGFRFRVKVDSFGHTVELEANQERMVKTEFDMEVHAYLLPDMMTELEHHKMTTEKRMTPKKIIIGMEVVRTGAELQKMNSNTEKWHNPNYPNLKYNTNIPAPGVALDTTIQDHSFLPTGKWAGIPVENSHLLLRVVPVPTTKNDVGQDGDMSYDDQFVYFMTNNRWTRVGVSEFQPVSSNDTSDSDTNKQAYIYSDAGWQKKPKKDIDFAAPAVPGNLLYDTAFLYIYVRGMWRRIALSEFQ